MSLSVCADAVTPNAQARPHSGAGVCETDYVATSVHAHACVQTISRTHARALVRKHVHIRKHAHMYTHAYSACARTHSTCTHARMHAHKHARIHACMHAQTHERKHAHTGGVVQERIFAQGGLLHVCVRARVNAYTCVCVCMCTCVRARVPPCVRACMHEFMCTCI